MRTCRPVTLVLFADLGVRLVTYLSLRDFLDVAGKTGKPRTTKIRQIKYADKYSPATDFYKPLRSGIVSIHKAGKSKAAMAGLLLGIGDKRKLANYPLAISGYNTWWGANQLGWFDPPKGKYAKHGFEVNVNPELGLKINGASHIIKLHLNTDPMPTYRAELTGALMTCLFMPSVPTALLGALDVRRSTLINATANAASLMNTIDSVLADMATIWPTV
jgi:hypothetical protein